MFIKIIILLLTGFLIGCQNGSAVEFALSPSKTIVVEITPEPVQASIPTLTTTPSTALLPTSTPTTEIEVISSRVSLYDEMTMVLVPAGQFEMGSEDGWESEKPVHKVFLRDYWIDQTEVTNQQYARCVEQGDCEPPGSSESFTRDDYYGDDAFASHPVINVSWYDAVSYCQWAGRRLPTEAEWEKAARGVNGNRFPWGQEISCALANYIGCLGDTSKAGSYPEGASPFGALDMAGNVWEWVADWYFIGYYKESPLDYPKGPDSGAYRVVRGGSWNDYDWYLRTTSRFSYFPDNKRVSIGFRCATDDAQ